MGTNRLPVNSPGKAEDDGPHAWTNARSVGGPDEALSSWLQSGSALTLVAIWGHEPAAGRLLSLCLSLPVTSAIEINKSLKKK